MGTAILVDTYILLWVRITPEKLSLEEGHALDAASSRFVSAASLWEIGILITLGRVGNDVRLFDLPIGFELLPVLPDHCKELIALPQLHRDPFDRMLIAQARSENLRLFTRDQAIIAYGGQGAAMVL